MGSTTRDRKLNGVRYTGFREPFSTDRNTTLPHPSADISPQASLEASDITIERSILRLLKYSRKRSYSSKQKGFLNLGNKYNDMQDADDLRKTKDGARV
ncbi:hypothetical protein O988_05514 [Pseudogymnoascus sp. VKM F-3808]|nr:hypothetical protein O988_05514 [Pseudogymnoascus sp. VKM F-3808]